MIYAIDTNIIYDIFLADPAFGPSSRDFVTGLYADGHSLIACDVAPIRSAAAPTASAASAAATVILFIALTFFRLVSSSLCA